MKKAAFLILLFVGIVTSLLSQNYEPLKGLETMNRTDLRFNVPRPGTTRVVFNFINPPSSTKIQLELSYIQDLNKLPNLDSLLALSLNAIRSLIDSTPNDIIARRIDVRPINNNVEIRMTSHESNQTTLIFQNETLQNFKIEQDTLRMSFLIPSKESTIKIYKGFLSIHINHLPDLLRLGDNPIAPCITILRKYLNQEMISKMYDGGMYSAIFNISKKEMIFPTTEQINKRGKRAFSRNSSNEEKIIPAIYGSMQFTRGSFVPSFAAGLSYIISNNKYNDHRLFLMWEPYFFFSNNNNQFQTYRNDFVTLRKIEFDKPEKGGWSFVQNFSIGYLVGRRGNLFEENTFKFSLPGIRNHTLQIEPEFYFNNFFKNFSPTLRLGLYFE
jgi:hypothetical protein